jgi:hypothetical protein
MIDTGESGAVPGICSPIKAQIIHNLILGKNQEKSLGDSIGYKIGILAAAGLYGFYAPPNGLLLIC